MDKPTFIDGVTKICADWCNTVSDTVWDALGQAKTPLEARTNIDAAAAEHTHGGDDVQITYVPEHYTPDNANLEGHIAGIDDQLASAGGVVPPHAGTHAWTGADPISPQSIRAEPEGTRMRWMNAWTDITYEQFDVVRDEDWVMVANKQTTDRAAPQPLGLETYVYSGDSPTDVISAKQLDVAQRYTYSEAGYMTGIRMYTIAGNIYRVWFVKDPEGEAIVTEIVSQFTAQSTGWDEFAISNVLIPSGTTFELILTMFQPDPTPTTFSGNWSYLTPGNGTTPVPGQILHVDQETASLKVHKTDNDAGDRSAELAGLAIGDVINGPGGIAWAIQAIQDNTDWIDFAIAPAQQGTPDGVFNFVFETVSPSDITIIYDSNYWSANADVSGRYRIDNGSWVVTEDQYSIDLQIQYATISADWDLLTVMGAGGGGGGYSREELDAQILDAKGGRKNMAINGDFRINQRSGTRTPGVGVYGYDRWKGHASGLEQVVEQENLRDGIWTLSWSGGGNGSLDGGASAASPITQTITADHDVSVIVPSDATDVQLEFGSQATAFELRPIGEELALCQRYYQTLSKITVDQISGLKVPTQTVMYNTQMRGNPTVITTKHAGGTTVITPYPLVDSCRFVSGSSGGVTDYKATFDAEL